MKTKIIRNTVRPVILALLGEGMKHCSEWLKSFVNEVPIKFIPAGDPFWTS